MKEKTKSWIVVILLFIVGIIFLPIGLLLYYVADIKPGEYLILIGGAGLVISIVSAFIMFLSNPGKKCPQCGKNIPEGSKFCLECGGELN